MRVDVIALVHPHATTIGESVNASPGSIALIEGPDFSLPQ
jgi:hypothetical protein